MAPADWHCGSTGIRLESPMNLTYPPTRSFIGGSIRMLAPVLSAVLLTSISLANDGIAFFESRIRPVLVEHCYECHNTAETAEADLALDSRAGIRATTKHGTVVVPGDSEASLLLKVIRHEIADLEMPANGAKLDANVIDDFQKWIDMNAPDGRDSPPSAAELAESTSWERTLEQRKRWWSFQPIQDPSVPEVEAATHPIDRFVRAKLVENKLEPSPRADRRTLARRLSFALTGLPPRIDTIEQFLANEGREVRQEVESDDAYAALVDQYLDSPHFGERWARHWMDLVRYADSHGSEGDPAIPHAYQYRDYLIRAFNADVPYDQLVREHLAGDLLGDPRTNDELGINESAIGPAHFRFVFHGFAPTDALDEKVRFTDDQVNVVTKAFLGLTVSCARCHNHKFDAISQTDYYALFGILASCRPALRDVNLPELQQASKNEIQALKDLLRPELAKAWSKSNQVSQLLDPSPELEEKIAAASEPHQLLHFWKQLTSGRKQGQSFSDAWTHIRAEWEEQQKRENQPTDVRRWDFRKENDYHDWFRYGNGLPEAPGAPGAFSINTTGPVVQGVFPAGVISHGISQRHRGFLTSPRFKLDGEYNAWLLLAGRGQPSVRYAVENYPRNGTVYPIPTIDNASYYWQQLKLKYWQGDFIHFELATSKDAPLQNRNRDKSWFGIRDVVVRNSNDPGPPDVSLEYLTPLFQSEGKPAAPEELIERIQDSLRVALQAWEEGSASDQQALFINACLPLLPNEVESLPVAATTINEIRELQARIPPPTRVPGVVEADSFDQPLYVRGDHRRPAEVVQRRFLEAIDKAAYEPRNSGRRDLAESILADNNPLTARVIVNRIWHYLFGQGIVATPDNFGKLGDTPSHPELLDYLATRFRREGWSIKKTIRLIVTSETWRATTLASEAAREQDPANRLLSHTNVVRLDAESIRDSLIAVSGQLDARMYGTGFPANEESGRRSVYVTSKRNSLDQFLQTFDAPTPFSTTGRRDATNTPNQSLTMMNDSRVIELAKKWAESTSTIASDRTRINKMFYAALSRPPTNAEANALEAYLSAAAEESQGKARRIAKLEHRLRKTEMAIAAILDPARKRLLEARSEPAGPIDLKPIAAWDFAGDLRDRVGKLHGTAHGASIEDGALVLDGKSWAATGALPKDLREKTLQARVQLATLDQGGGGVITIETADGARFDSIVFAERQPGQWIAGSDGFARTEDLDGDLETEAAGRSVSLTVTYNTDGTIRVYRDGRPYGRATNKGKLQPFKAVNSRILFGLRHSEPSTGKMLKGKISEARLYDRALSPEEVAAFATGSSYVSEAELLDSLTQSQTNEVASLKQELDAIKAELDELQLTRLRDPWTRAAHAIFNLKEFIYLK